MSEQKSFPAPSLVGVSGSPTRPSRTTALVEEVTETFARSLGGTPTVNRAGASAGPSLGRGRSAATRRDARPPLETVEKPM